MSEIRMRPFDPEADGPRTLEVFRTAVHQIAAKDYSIAQLEAWAPAHMELAHWVESRSRKPTWVALAEGSIQGFIDLTAHGLIDMLYVHGAFAHRKVATTCLEQVMAVAKAQSLQHLTTVASITARPFFESFGFMTLNAQHVFFNGQQFLNFKMKKSI